jgi:hypothetical protein
LISKMNDVVKNAVYYSDCTQVPTSLWVEARVCYAKQMVMEDEPKKAYEVLKDICNIMPPMPLDDLSFSTAEKVYSKTKKLDINTALSQMLNQEQRQSMMAQRLATSSVLRRVTSGLVTDQSLRFRPSQQAERADNPYNLNYSVKFSMSRNVEQIPESNKGLENPN